MGEQQGAAMNDPVSVGVPEAARRMGVSKVTVYAEINAGRLKSFKLGHRRLIRVAAIEEWAEALELAGGGGSARPGGSNGPFVNPACTKDS